MENHIIAQYWKGPNSYSKGYTTLIELFEKCMAPKVQYAQYQGCSIVWGNVPWGGGGSWKEGRKKNRSSTVVTVRFQRSSIFFKIRSMKVNENFLIWTQDKKNVLMAHHKIQVRWKASLLNPSDRESWIKENSFWKVNCLTLSNES